MNETNLSKIAVASVAARRAHMEEEVARLSAKVNVGPVDCYWLDRAKRLLAAHIKRHG